MANTLTGLIPDLYAAIDKVSRELTGYIPAVGTSLSSVAVAINQAIKIPITAAQPSVDVTPSMTLTEPADQTVTNVEVKITKSKSVAFGFVGEEQKGLNSSGAPGHLNIQAKMIAQAMRTLVNEAEEDIAQEAYKAASRAHGTAGTAPFASDLKDLGQIKKILKDNGAPLGDLQLVMDTTAGANLTGLTQLTNVNQSGDEGLLRQGLFNKPLVGFDLRETGQGQEHVVGAGTGYLVNNGAGYVKGDTSIVVGTGSGTINAGDTVTFAGHTDSYVVVAELTAPGTLVIAAPGLRQDVADTVAVTNGADDYAANVAFDRDAIQFVARPPAMPDEGDARMDSMIITDPNSGLSFEISVWGGNRKVKYEVALAWGVKAIKSEHIVLLRG